MSARWLMAVASIWCSTVVCPAIPARAAAQSSRVAPPPAGAPGQSSVASPTAAGASPLERRITLELRDVPLDTALQEIAARTGVRLIYSARVVPLARRVSARVENGTVRDALDDVLAGVNVEVKVSGDRIVLNRGSKPRRTSDAAADSAFGWIYGRVSDSVTARPLAGAVVSVKGTAISMAANEQGSYVLARVPAGVHTITVRLLGYAYVERQIALADSQRLREDFALRMSMSRLPEVVTTASGPRRKMELGNDIVRIDADSIARTEPITSVTDLLEGRVPGLTVQRTSGAPGDPARIRLRGSSSPNMSNDPIVIVDGVRVYAAQSDTRNRNLAAPGFAAPSPLDYIDPHGIETIEVLKGPSAATLYGADAANGVIVVTTKKGRAGPSRWTASIERGISKMPDRYPDAYLRWGHRPWDGTPMWCPIREIQCIADSVSRFQALNDPALTILDQGQRLGVTLGVSGGSDALQFALSGNYSDEEGLIRLPSLETQRYRASHGTNPPDWMQRPQGLTRWGGSSRLTARLGPKADVALTAMLTRTEQRRSTLEQELTNLMATYVDQSTGTYYRAGYSTITPTDAILSDYYRRATSVATNFTNGVNLDWRPTPWLTTSMDGGLNVIQREDGSLLPRGAVLTADSIGAAAVGRGTSVMSTVNLRAMATKALPWGFTLQAAAGANYTNERTADVIASATDIYSTSLQGARGEVLASDDQQEQATFGWYVEPSISHKRFWLTTGIRLDGGNAFGSRITLVGLPKIGASYLISDEPWFPFKPAINTLRLRAAYGQAGVQPGAGDRFRLYGAPGGVWVDGRSVTGMVVATLGNTKIKPERSKEIEGGFDADLFDDRIALGVSGYRKTRIDALMSVPLPPSVYGGRGVLRNIGTIRNSGYELTLGAQLVRTDLVRWGVQLQMSHNENVVVELGPGVLPFGAPDARVVEGYPLFGRWGTPVLGYSDTNGDGILQDSEVLYGDSLVYLGATEPDYTAGLSTTLSLFRGALSVSAGFTYESGLNQIGPWKSLAAISRGMNDPSASLADQALVVSSRHTTVLNAQTVDMLRFNSLSVAYSVPPRTAARLGLRALTIALQGTNLGLHTNYRGMDPNVNGSTGNSVIDTGQQPQPRTWQLRVSTSY